MNVFAGKPIFQQIAKLNKAESRRRRQQQRQQKERETERPERIILRRSVDIYEPIHQVSEEPNAIP